MFTSFFAHCFSLQPTLFSWFNSLLVQVYLLVVLSARLISPVLFICCILFIFLIYPQFLILPLASTEFGVEDFGQHFENHILLVYSICYCWEEVSWLWDSGYVASNVIPIPLTFDWLHSHQGESQCGFVFSYPVQDFRVFL